MKVTQRQKEILTLIYKFRFLNRKQIQSLLNHKQWTKVIIWLNTLTEQKYLKRYYEQKVGGEPAAYSLGTNGRKYLKTAQIQDINITLLDRVWKESQYTKTFKKHCMFIADIYLSLVALVQKVDEGKGTLRFFTKTDLTGVDQIIVPEPDAYFIIEDKEGYKKRYFLDLFDFYTKEKDMKKRINNYVTYFESNIWQEQMQTDFPEIILVCSNSKTKQDLYKHIAANKRDDMKFYLSTREEIQKHGMTGQVLHKVN